MKPQPLGRRLAGIISLLFAALAAGSIPAQDFTAAVVATEQVPAGAQWKLFRGTAEPSGSTLEWTTADFDDVHWELGAAGFGYGDADDATILSDMRNRYSTVYLRRTFAVADPSSAGALELVVDYDDGFVAYLNGREVARTNAGAVGTRPTFDALALDSHEAGTPETFAIGDGAALLAAGDNVLAIIGLNGSLDSVDFSLHPRLRSASFVGRGCAGDFYAAGGQVTLAGTAPTAATVSVRVNGKLADFAAGAWTHRAALPDGGATFAAEALDATGAVVASRTLRVVRVRELKGDLADGTTLRRAASPYVVTHPLTLAAGRRLEIEAGCDLYFLAGTGLRVEGTIVANGTSLAPIRFTRLPCGANWGSFELQGSRGGNRFAFCEWSHATGDPGCLTLDDSDLELESCAIRDIDGEGVHAVGGTIRIRRCLTERTLEALSLDRGNTVVEYCTVRDAIGKSDLIDCNRSTDPPPRLRFNHIYGTSDDGIDADGSSIFAEGNVIHDCGDQAFSLVGVGTSQLTRNLCYRNGHGLSVKDAHVCIAEFNTFTLNTVTGVRAIEKTAGRGGGSITLGNSIVWSNAVELLAEDGGAIDANHCDVGGGAPAGTGNLSLDPLFVDITAAVFHLQAGSPCLGRASDGSDLGALPFELAPREPSDLGAITEPPNAIWLAWQDNSVVETSFELERAVGGGIFALVATLPAGAVSFTDQGLASGETYRYRVRATNALGVSPWSAIVSATLESLSPPELLAIEPATGPSQGGTSVTLRGHNFISGVAVTIGGSPLTEVLVVSSEELRGLTPAGRRGRTDVLVSTPAGQAELPEAFAYVDIYRRGDANGDHSRDIADALAILRYLFQNGAEPPCIEVANTNSDADVDLADAVFVLLYLFASGGAPTPEEVACGE